MNITHSTFSIGEQDLTMLPLWEEADGPMNIFRLGVSNCKNPSNSPLRCFCRIDKWLSDQINKALIEMNIKYGTFYSN